MSTYYLAAVDTALPLPPSSTEEQSLLVVALESLDGNRRVTLDGSQGWTHMPGSTGLEMPPFDVVTADIPGVPGTVLQDVRPEQRRVFLPLFIGTGVGSHVEQLTRLDLLRSIVDPTTGMFRIVGSTARSERELAVVYTGGLEGDDSVSASGLVWNKVGLTAIACEPFARDRTDRAVEFRSASAGGAFIGSVGGTDALWPTSIATSTVIGEGMSIFVASEVPVYPTLELTGPMDSFEGTLSPVVTSEDGTVTSHAGHTWSVSVPAGVPDGSTLRLVTDPRARSIRLDGAPAAGLVARGSTLRPFYPGFNILDVSAPGGTADTLIRISWREQFRSLW